MKNQWVILLGIVFTLIVAIFAVINVDPVTVNYLFGQSNWPLILVILGSVLMGGLIIGSVGIVRVFNLQKQVNGLKKELHQFKHEASETNDGKKEGKPAKEPKKQLKV
ncbi:LapA family protein [Cytobacillus purgationiresistens]|uniref:Integral membrane protein n=1 Tax=Cytobacillus purgationiresistens TaxID=863449 RepID=A0ABU0AF22_9BACI|nr:lipopolysaccharide assembly LapA domain-containing protein [Cytobacillus purgationiresistens]MDQ0269862.1 putative integral membrane protein [Cytobacillus purgationiresistens]